MKKLLWTGLLAAGAMIAQPAVKLRQVVAVSACTSADCVTTLEQRRELMIIAPVEGATAYQVEVITPDWNGGRRSWSFLIPRRERRFGDFAAVTSATFFVLPIDLDLPILDLWVSALVRTGESARLEGK